MSDKKPVARREVKVAIAYPPFVSLLPPEVGRRKAAARARRRAIFLALVALGVAILAAVGANIYSLQRAATLDDARARTLFLTQQQGEYNDVRTANQLLKSTKAARNFALSSEVSFKALIDGINSKLGSGMAITDYSFSTATPLQSYAQSLSPLDPAAMAGFSLDVTAGSVAEIDDWVRNLSSVDGVLGATLLTVKLDEGTTYRGTVTVLIGQEALLHRFDGLADEEEATEEPAPAPVETPAPTNSPETDSGTDDEEAGA